MATGNKIRVGVVGHGHFGTYHARQYAAHPDVELVGIADPSEKAAEAIAKAHGDIRLADYRELIGKVDAVSIAVPTAMHEGVARNLIEAGIHVLIEKPLAPTADIARDLTALAERNSVVLNVGHIERFSATYERLKTEMSGRPVLVDAHRHAPWLGRILDVDVILDMMIHDIDLVLDLASSEPVSVTASGVAMMGHGLDAIIARVSFADGMTAHLSATRVAAATSRQMRIVENGRTLTADFGRGQLGVFTPDWGKPREEDVPHRDALRAEIDAFLAAVRGEGGGGVSGAEAAKAIALAEEIRAAADSRHGDLTPVQPTGA